MEFAACMHACRRERMDNPFSAMVCTGSWANVELDYICSRFNLGDHLKSANSRGGQTSQPQPGLANIEMWELFFFSF